MRNWVKIINYGEAFYINNKIGAPICVPTGATVFHRDIFDKTDYVEQMSDLKHVVQYRYFKSVDEARDWEL